MDKEIIDGLIWIGQSYKKILCDSAVSCAFPYKKGSLCYVHEAERRGCCRKVPFKPEWMEPGKSRIFLAHRDDQKAHSKGRIFGYFVLAGVEEVAPARTIPLLLSRDVRQVGGDPGTGDLMLRVFRADLGTELSNAKIEAVSETGDRLVVEGTTGKGGGYLISNLPVKRYELTVSTPGYEAGTTPGICVTEKRKLSLDIYVTPRKPREKDKLTRKCWDGSMIVTHVFLKGRWVKTDETCPPIPKLPRPPKRRVILQNCWDGSEIVVARWEGGQWVSTGAKCPKFPVWPEPGHPDDEPPVDENIFEEHRDCSLRLKPRGIYLMDALAKEISTAFHCAPKLRRIQREYLRAKSDTERLNITIGARHVFNVLVNDILRDRRRKTCIPPGLSRWTEPRGELVLFKDWPVLERKPQAAFRGLLRIDGNRLIERIKQGVSPIGIDSLR